MSWSWTLYRYLARQFAAGIVMMYAGFLVLVFSIDVVNLLGRTAGRDVSSNVIAGMALLHTPVLGIRLLPFAVLFGAVYCFIRLSRSQELVAPRAAGRYRSSRKPECTSSRVSMATFP